MKKAYKREKLVAEINITPFTDVILVLLVIFMITTPLISQTNIKVRLPEAKSGQLVEAGKKAQIYIAVTDNGAIYLDKERVTKKELRVKIDSMHRGNPDMGAVIHSDRMVPFEDVVGVLDVLNEVGVNKLNIGTMSEKEGKR